jgi:TRAP-type C4-dicarboxylate transport system permease small subunit
MQIERYNPKDPREIRKSISSVYIKNYPITWTEEVLRGMFSKYGDISCVYTMMK